MSTWKYRIEATPQLPTEVTGSLLGHQVQIRLNLSQGATTKAKIEGGISFECRNEPTLPAGCYPKMFDLGRSDPAVTASFNTTPYQNAQMLTGLAGTLLDNVTIDIVQPRFTVIPSMQVVSTSAGKCYNIFIAVRIEYTPGKLIIDPPDITIPGTGISIPLGPYELNIGQQIASTLTAQYVVCCCWWSETFRDYDQTLDGGILNDNVEYSDEPNSCIFDFMAEDPRLARSGSTELINWEITALEGPCEKKVVQVELPHVDTQSRLRNLPTPPPKSEVSRTP